MNPAAQNKKGFTLIELLVVISIIALLSTVVFSQMDDARKKSQFSKESQGVKQIQNALELYRNKYGIYLGEDTWASNNASNPPGVIYSNWAAGSYNGSEELNNYLQPLVSEGFISSIPNLPYSWPANGTNYEWYYYYVVKPTDVYDWGSGLYRYQYTCGGVPVTEYMLYTYMVDTELATFSALPFYGYILTDPNGSVSTWESTSEFCVGL